MFSKSRVEMIKIAEEIGIEIEFDSSNPGVTTLDENGEIISHKSYGEVWSIFKEVFDIEE